MLSVTTSPKPQIRFHDLAWPAPTQCSDKPRIWNGVRHFRKTDRESTLLRQELLEVPARIYPGRKTIPGSGWHPLLFGPYHPQRGWPVLIRSSISASAFA